MNTTVKVPHSALKSFLGSHGDHFMKNLDNDAYLGHWYDKVHDFNLAATKTFAEEEKMLTFSRAID